MRPRRRLVRYVPPEESAETQRLRPVARPKHRAVVRERVRPRRAPGWLALLLLAILVPIALGVAWAATRDDEPKPRVIPARVTDVPHRDEPAAQARALSEWLRDNSG